MSKITVIIPAFNVAAHLRAVLYALQSQRVENSGIEVVLVDNNSTDATAAIAREYPWVRILHEPTQGSYAARNRAIRETDSEVVVFLDPDCLPRPGWLEAAGHGLADGSKEIVLGRRFYGPSHALSLLAAYEDEKIQWILRNGRADQIYGYTNNMAVRRRTLERFGPFPERSRGGDTIFVQQVVSVLGPGCVTFAPAMGVDHLEVAKLRDYYGKRFIYGASNEQLAREVPFRPLSIGQRFAVLWSLLSGGRVAPWNAVLLLALLVPGAIAYDRGRRWAR